MSNAGSEYQLEAMAAATTELEINLDLFEPFERLIEIEILGQKCRVPENNSLLRCFQYLFLEPISYGGFCWNGTCRTCEVHYHLGDGRDRTCLACSTKAVEGMVITHVSPEIRFT
jgi:NADH dehydrogenase/NADH:ubiquinone oxidoreductase subunit G